MKHFETTNRKAIQKAKDFLRAETNVKRIDYSTVDYCSTRCGCGETGCVKVSAKIKSDWHFSYIGVCKQCAN